MCSIVRQRASTQTYILAHNICRPSCAVRRFLFGARERITIAPDRKVLFICLCVCAESEERVRGTYCNLATRHDAQNSCRSHGDSLILFGPTRVSNII